MSKFNSRVDEFAYMLSLDGSHDDEIGSVDELGWFCLFNTSEDPFTPSEETIKSLQLDEDNVSFLENVCGGCIVEEDIQGFVNVDFFDNEDELHKSWDAICYEYLQNDSYFEEDE